MRFISSSAIYGPLHARRIFTSRDVKFLFREYREVLIRVKCRKKRAERVCGRKKKKAHATAPRDREIIQPTYGGVSASNEEGDRDCWYFEGDTTQPEKKKRINEYVDKLPKADSKYVLTR